MNVLRVVIIGAGGHAQVVADALLSTCKLNSLPSAGGVQPVGFVDDDVALTGREFLGLPVFGPVACLKEMEHDAVVVAIGDNASRQRLTARLKREGERFVTVCHPSAIIAPNVKIGLGVMISAGVIVNAGSLIGDSVILNTGCTVDHHNRVGDYAHIAPGVHLGGDVRIGEGTLVGIGAIVLPQRQVGAWCVVGGGSLITRDLEDGKLAVGVPAKVVEKN